MSESLKDILKRRGSNNPPEIAIIKNFVEQRFKAVVTVSINDTQIIINTQNSALAGTLRLNIFELQNTVKSKKKLIIRTG
ncbi:hypothetical protein KDA11_02210 [Candidatus Saccharibacteria bacterium]|nr:hypothetical protein [Candidatus Saccharibacteria bacterium]